MKLRWGLVALGLLIPLVQIRVDRARGAFRAQEEALYLWSGEHARRLNPGLENVLADVYWLRTIQYFGGQRAFDANKRFELLQPLIDITTTLDPRFEMAYRYGAVFLAEPPPVGAGQPLGAVALLERGCRENPDAWRLRQDLGFFHFFFLKDAAAAARVLTEGAKLPGAPYWLESTAADFLRRGNEREASRRLWQRMYEQTDGPMRENALFNLRRLDALDMVAAHQSAVEEFARRSGRPPGALSALAAAGLLRAPLVDSAGTPFDYDPLKAEVSISNRSSLWRAN